MSQKARCFRGRKESRLCGECGERPATFVRPGDGRVVSDDEHTLCAQCHRSLRDATRQHCARRPIVVTFSSGDAVVVLELQARWAWKEQNRLVLEALHHIRTQA